MFSPSSVGGDRRQLVKPSQTIPFSVDVVSAIPKLLVDRQGDIAATASCPGWACASLKDGMVYIWQHVSKKVSEKIEPPKPMKLYFPDLLGCAQPLLGLSSEGDSVNMYLLCGDWLLLRKLSTRDFNNNSGNTTGTGTTSRKSTSILMRAHTAKLRIVLETATTTTDDAMMDDNGDRKERVVSLTASPSGISSSPLVVLGTSKGNLYWVSHTAVPVGMQLQRVVAPSSSGLWNRFFSVIPKATTMNNSVQSYFVLPVQGELQFWAVSASQLVQWTVSTLSSTNPQQPTFTPSSNNNNANWTSLLEFTIQGILECTLDRNNDCIHLIVRGTPNTTTATNSRHDEKLYWLQVDLQGGSIQKSHWLSRFASPEQVQVLGLACAQNSDAYASFHDRVSNSVIVMVLEDVNNFLQEVDLPTRQVPNLIPNMFQQDVVTHGCNMVATSGIGLRVRCLQTEQQQTRISPNKRMKRTRRTASSTPPTTLLAHLRSFFWQSYQDSSHQRPMPPSLNHATQDDLEQVAVAFCTELQRKGDTSSAQNPMEWHKSLIELLQQGGLYRTLSQATRWQLMGIGQELAVFGQLARACNSNNKGATLAEYAKKRPLMSFEIGQWLLDLWKILQNQQQDVGAFSSQWNDLLTLALETATSFRQEMAQPFYDIVNGDAPPPLEDGNDVDDEPLLWTSHHSLQNVLLQQLEEWKRNKAEGVDLAHVESVVKAALVSYSEFSKKEGGRSLYPRVRELAIDLLRETTSDKGLDDDELAFELSIQHKYYKGLCRISVHHEKKRDANRYSLDPLFATFASFSDSRDLESGLSFPQYVLQWHTENGLYGHAINYGRHAPHDLRVLMTGDERLQNYQWIPAIRQQYYQQATDACLAVGEKASNNFASHQWALSMAKLTNKLVINKKAEQTKTIEKQLELIEAQNMLLNYNNKGNENADSRLLSAEELVHLALKKLVSGDDLQIEDHIKLATIALAVCNSMADEKISLELTALVWAECFRLDEKLWMQWIRQHPTSDQFFQETVFGALLQECRKDDNLSKVWYGRHIELAVLDKLGKDQASKVEISRLLRSVTVVDDAIEGQSLMVSSF